MTGIRSSPYSAEEIATPSAENRAVSSPYTKLLAANIQVDQAAGLIICSARTAEQTGVRVTAGCSSTITSAPR